VGIQPSLSDLDNSETKAESVSLWLLILTDAGFNPFVLFEYHFGELKQVAG
jgi:hypothetical protein